MSNDGHFYSPLVWSLAVLFGASSVVLGVFMLSSILGPFEILDRSTPFSPALSGIWWPRSASGSGAEGEQRLAAWRSALRIESEPPISRDLETLRAGGIELVAVADATRLTEQEREDLLAYVEGGGGALLAGAIAVRDREGHWIGWDAMAEFLGVEKISSVDAAASRALLCARRGPVSAPLLPGCSVRLSRAPGAPAIDDDRAELWWQGGDQASRAASRRLRIGAGRIVWLGAGPEAGLGDTDESHDPMRKLLQAAGAWATGRPFLEVLAWPQGQSFAAEVPSAIMQAQELEGEAVDPAPPTATISEASSRSDALSGRVALAQLRGDHIRLSLRDLEPAAGAPAPAEALRAAGGWLADAGEIEDWSRQRGAVLTALEAIGPRRLLITVTNRNRERLQGLVLRVHLNRPYEDLEVGVLTVLQALPTMQIAEGGDAVDLRMPPLNGRASYAWALDGLPNDELRAPGGLPTSVASRTRR